MPEIYQVARSKLLAKGFSADEIEAVAEILADMQKVQFLANVSPLEAVESLEGRKSLKDIAVPAGKGAE
ncbi:MAG: hypothetical protein IMZ61_08845 [Planctomycetes bacterium]|nr:hypothetical protein [Planctomycetota bacterium]